MTGLCALIQILRNAKLLCFQMQDKQQLTVHHGVGPMHFMQGTWPSFMQYWHVYRVRNTSVLAHSLIQHWSRYSPARLCGRTVATGGGRWSTCHFRWVRPERQYVLRPSSCWLDLEPGANEQLSYITLCHNRTNDAYVRLIGIHHRLAAGMYLYFRPGIVSEVDIREFYIAEQSFRFQAGFRTRTDTRLLQFKTITSS